MNYFTWLKGTCGFGSRLAGVNAKSTRKHKFRWTATIYLQTCSHQHLPGKMQRATKSRNSRIVVSQHFVFTAEGSGQLILFSLVRSKFQLITKASSGCLKPFVTQIEFIASKAATWIYRIYSSRWHQGLQECVSLLEDVHRVLTVRHCFFYIPSATRSRSPTQRHTCIIDLKVGKWKQQTKPNF